MGVHIEVWTGEVIKKFRRSGDFMDTVPDRSNLVENKVIHLVDLGADPNVLVNNTTYAIPTVEATDTDVAISLDKFDTENTSVKDDHLYAISYDIIGQYTDVHAEALQEKTADKAIHALAPTTNSTATPIILATGGTDDGVNPRKKLTKSDILALKKAFDKASLPKKGRVLVLCPEHVQHILEFDEQFERQYQDVREGQVLKLYGFDVYEYSKTPVYDATNTKKAFTAADAPTTDRYASVAFYAPRMFKAMDTPDMYYRDAKENPEFRMTTVGFRHYFICLPKKMEAIGALVSPPTA